MILFELPNSGLFFHNSRPNGTVWMYTESQGVILPSYWRYRSVSAAGSRHSCGVTEPDGRLVCVGFVHSEFKSALIHLFLYTLFRAGGGTYNSPDIPDDFYADLDWTEFSSGAIRPDGSILIGSCEQTPASLDLRSTVPAPAQWSKIKVSVYHACTLDELALAVVLAFSLILGFLVLVIY
jgi:hypothetical protein